MLDFARTCDFKVNVETLRKNSTIGHISLCHWKVYFRLVCARMCISMWISFLGLPLTKYHKVDGLKQQQFIVSVMGARSLKSRWQQYWFPLGLWKNFFFFPFFCPSFWWLLTVLGIHCNLCLHLHMVFFLPCLSQQVWALSSVQISLFKRNQSLDQGPP